MCSALYQLYLKFGHFPAFFEGGVFSSFSNFLSSY